MEYFAGWVMEDSPDTAAARVMEALRNFVDPASESLRNLPDPSLGVLSYFAGSTSEVQQNFVGPTLGVPKNSVHQVVGQMVDRINFVVPALVALPSYWVVREVVVLAYPGHSGQAWVDSKSSVDSAYEAWTKVVRAREVHPLLAYSLSSLAADPTYYAAAGLEKVLGSANCVHFDQVAADLVPVLEYSKVELEMHSWKCLVLTAAPNWAAVLNTVVRETEVSRKTRMGMEDWMVAMRAGLAEVALDQIFLWSSDSNQIQILYILKTLTFFMEISLNGRFLLYTLYRVVILVLVSDSI